MFRPFLVVPEKGELLEKASRLGIKCFVIKFSRLKSLNIFSFLFDFIRLWKIIDKEKIALIHTDSPRQTIYAGLVRKIYYLPVVFHLRTSDVLPIIDRMLYTLVDCLIAVSKCVAQRFRLIDRKNKLRVVYNGVELESFFALDRDTHSRVLKVGYFGRIERRKGIEILIKAIKRVKGRSDVVIMGDGDNRYLEELRTLAKGENVIFKKYKSDVSEDMKKVEVVVLPSLKEEGLSRVVIESMALGKVVVVSDLCSNREALGNEFEEFIFPVGNDFKLASIIERIANDRNIIFQNQKKLRKRAEELFDIKKNTQEIEKIYIAIIKKAI